MDSPSPITNPLKNAKICGPQPCAQNPCAFCPESAGRLRQLLTLSNNAALVGVPVSRVVRRDFGLFGPVSEAEDCAGGFGQSNRSTGLGIQCECVFGQILIEMIGKWHVDWSAGTNS